MKLNIEWLEDYFECDTCGTSWEQGAKVTLDEKEILNLIPKAHCTGGTGWETADIFRLILNTLGYTINEN